MPRFGFDKVMKQYNIDYRTITAGNSKDKLSPFKPEDPQEVAEFKTLLTDIHGEFKRLVLESSKRRGSAAGSAPGSAAGSAPGVVRGALEAKVKTAMEQGGGSLAAALGKVGGEIGEDATAAINSRNNSASTSSTTNNNNLTDGQIAQTIEKSLFQGDFWVARRALNLGLIDEIGFLDDVIAHEFGKDAVLQEIKKPMSGLQKLLEGAEASAWLPFNLNSTRSTVSSTAAYGREATTATVSSEQIAAVLDGMGEHAMQERFRVTL